MNIRLNIILSAAFFMGALHSNIVVILNGASSSGKSTLQKHLVAELNSTKKFSRPFIRTGFDTLFVYPSPSPFTYGIEMPNFDSSKFASVKQIVDINGVKTAPLSIGKEGFLMIQAMHESILVYANYFHLCIDYVNYSNGILNDLVNLLKSAGHKVYVVKISVDIKTLEDREVDRQNTPGHARSHFRTVHKNIAYDLTVDNNSRAGSDEKAKRVANSIVEG